MVVDWRYTKGHTDNVVLVAWSPNGKYLLTSGKDSVVAVWDVAAKKVVSRLSHEGIVCGAAWRAEGNAVAMVGPSQILLLLATSWATRIDLLHCMEVGVPVVNPRFRGFATDRDFLTYSSFKMGHRNCT